MVRLATDDVGKQPWNPYGTWYNADHIFGHGLPAVSNCTEDESAPERLLISTGSLAGTHLIDVNLDLKTDRELYQTSQKLFALILSFGQGNITSIRTCSLKKD